MPQAEPKNDPIFQYTLEFFATDFQRLSRGPHARAFGDGAVEWLRIVDDLLARVAHGRSDVVRQHILILARAASWSLVFDELLECTRPRRARPPVVGYSYQVKCLPRSR